MGEKRRVLIAGGGPVGLFTALHLVREGIPVTVFEAESTLSDEYRAAGWHAPTVDMLEDIGALEPMLEKGTVYPYMRFSNKKYGDEFSIQMKYLEGEGVRNTWVLCCSQAIGSQVFYELLGDYPLATVLMGHRVVSVSQDENEVTVEVETPDGQKTFEGEWLIGTDGARSVVRRCMDVEFEGFTWHERFLIAEITDDEAVGFEEHFGLINFVMNGKDWRLVLKLPNGDGSHRWRIVCSIAEDLSDEVAKSDDYVQEVLQDTFRREKPYRIDERRSYRVHQRTASSFREGRLLLAGDAAHINNPLGGHGLNSGLHDSVNLCEKFVRVWRNEADATLLDLYDRQRRITNLKVTQPATVANKRRTEETNPLKQRLNWFVMSTMIKIPRLRRKMLLRASMIESLRYAERIQ